MLQSEALQRIATLVAGCRKCPALCALRDENSYLTVPGEGAPNAKLMILGEAPGEDEANSGRPFVGRAGKLLDKIIESAGWKRSDVFIANMLKCRPPNNRTPEAEEVSNCRNFLDLQIRCVNPSWILCLGKTASVHLLGLDPDCTMGSLRGETYEYQGRKVACTYHPSYLLRTPAAKKDVWEDIQPIILALQAAETV